MIKSLTYVIHPQGCLWLRMSATNLLSFCGKIAKQTTRTTLCTIYNKFVHLQQSSC